MSVLATTSVSTALQQPFQRQAWILPDNSLVLIVNLGTINFGGSNTNHAVVLQSTNWQSGSPTWSFIKQISTSLTAASYFDGTRLHITYASLSAGSTSGLFYISASYSGGVFTWDSSPTTLLAASDPNNCASSCAISADATGAVYVAYRNQAISGAINSVCLFTKGPGGWNSAPVQASATTGTVGTYYGALAYDGANTLLITVENATYYAQVHPDSGAWGSATSGPTSQIGTGQQFGPVSAITDGSSGAWVGISTTSGMKAQHLTWTGNAITWAQTATVIDSATNVSAPQWLYCNGVLYGYYFKVTSTNNADCYLVQYNPLQNSWASPVNLTNSAASNNVNPVAPRNYAYSGSVPVMPVIYESGTASPFNLNLLTQSPLALSTALDFKLRFGLANTLKSKDITTRLNMGPSHDIVTRLNLQPPTVATDSLPEGKFGLTYGLRGASDSLDIRVPILARALGMTWFRIQMSIGYIWTNQSDITSGTITTTAQTNPNWAPLDQAVGLLNQFGLHVVFPLRAVNGQPSWLFQNPAQQTSYSADGTGNNFAADPTNMALFAQAAAYRYDGIHGPIGPNGAPLKIDIFSVGNEEYNQLFQKKIVDSHGNPTAATIYGLYNSPYTSYNAIAPKNVGLPPQPSRDPHFFMNVVKAVSPAIKSIYPSALIGSCAIWWPLPQNISDFVAGCYAEGLKGLVSLFELHYYSNAIAPDVGSSSIATITDAITRIQAGIAAAGDTIPVMLGEFGWGTTDRNGGIDCDEIEQARRYSVVVNACLSLGVRYIFPYTLEYRTPASDTSSLIQYNATTRSYRLLPAFYTLQSLIQANLPPPGNLLALFPGPARRIGPFPGVARRLGQFPTPSRRQS